MAAKAPSPRPSPRGRGGNSKPSPEGRGRKAEPSVSPGIRERSRQLRREATEAESVLWRALRNRGLGAKFRRQHPVGPFVLDFYCHEARLAVELDGGGHAEPGRKARDAARSGALAGEGIRVLRFWNGDVMENVEGVLEVIRSALTPALSQGEREKFEALSQGEREGRKSE